MHSTLEAPVFSSALLKIIIVNGRHLSSDVAFIEKRRRGLARFTNALVRHPTLNQEQLVVMFLTVPTVGSYTLSSLGSSSLFGAGIGRLAKAGYHLSPGGVHWQIASADAGRLFTCKPCRYLRYCPSRYPPISRSLHKPMQSTRTVDEAESRRCGGYSSVFFSTASVDRDFPEHLHH